MENASKALIMAAGVLMGILILSLGVYLAYIFGDYASKTQAQISQKELAQFNDQFLKYDKRNNITMQDIVTVKNTALENNYKYSNYNTKIRANENNNFVDVYINSILILDIEDQKILLHSLNEEKHTCNVIISSKTGRVYKVYFTPTR